MPPSNGPTRSDRRAITTRRCTVSGISSRPSDARSSSRTVRPSGDVAIRLGGCGRGARRRRRRRELVASRAAARPASPSAPDAGRRAARRSRATRARLRAPTISRISSSFVATGAPSTSTMTSYGRRPARSAGEFGADVLHQRAARRRSASSERCRSGVDVGQRDADVAARHAAARLAAAAGSATAC